MGQNTLLYSQIYQPLQHLKLFVMARITKLTTINKTASFDFLNLKLLLCHYMQYSKAITPTLKYLSYTNSLLVIPILVVGA